MKVFLPRCIQCEEAAPTWTSAAYGFTVFTGESRIWLCSVACLTVWALSLVKAALT